MKLRYTTTKKNYLDFNIFHALNTDAAKALIKRTRIRPPLIWLLVSLAFCGYFFYEYGRFSIEFLLIILVTTALWYLLYPLCHREVLEWRFERWLEAGGGREFTGDVTLELLDDRLRAEDAAGVREVPYGEVERLVENKKCLYVYIGADSAFIVPLTAFDGDHAYGEFRARLEEGMRSAGKARDAA